MGHDGFAASGTVRQCVRHLRRQIGDGSDARSPHPIVVARCGGYALDETAVAIDADAFEAHVRRGACALEDGRPALATAHLQLATRCYGGDFLADEPHASWAGAERERLRTLMEHALSVLAAGYEDDGDGVAAAACLARLAGLQPLDGDVHRRLIGVLVAQGRRSAALRCYEAFSHRLQSCLRLRPDFAFADVRDPRPGPDRTGQGA